MVCYAATQLATRLLQRRIQVVRSNTVARKRLTKSNDTPAMNLILSLIWFGCCLEVDVRIRRCTNKRGIEKNNIHGSRLIFDFDISLFLSMWIILKAFESRVFIENMKIETHPILFFLIYECLLRSNLSKRSKKH